MALNIKIERIRENKEIKINKYKDSKRKLIKNEKVTKRAIKSGKARNDAKIKILIIN